MYNWWEMEQLAFDRMVTQAPSPTLTLAGADVGQTDDARPKRGQTRRLLAAGLLQLAGRIDPGALAAR